MRNYEAWSRDRIYGIRIPARVVKKMLDCSKRAGAVETGGILVGYYNRRRNCAILTDCSGAPRDSIRKRSYFQRGIRGLQRWILRLWSLKERRYYLGEWHFHPLNDPTPSSIDVDQMKEISQNEVQRCPEPLLVILGGDANKKWALKSFVYLREEGLAELVRGWEGRLCEG